MLTLKTRYFRTHKKAESLDDCQDAYAVNENAARYAIADGATRSFFPKWWAELLVRHFCETETLALDKTNWAEWLHPIQHEWYQKVSERVKARDLFYLTNSFNAKDPATSTFIGVEFNKVKAEWHAMVIGDSCLFHHTGTELKSYLVDSSESFTNRSEALASFADKNHYTPEFIGGEVSPGDTLILATDALAKWILEHREAGKFDRALAQLKAIKTDDAFSTFVDEGRVDEDIRLVNDDVALVLISVEEVAEDELEGFFPEEVQADSVLLRLLFWGVLATGAFGILVWFLILLWRFLKKDD